jgi:threonine dehydrogenase-like Zn-dependent dehydrogenase
MRALRVHRGELELIRDHPEPEPGAGQALVAVELAGICRTDLEILAGYMSFSGVPGHEFVGRVLRAPGAEEWVGRRVVAEINLACGSCAWCRRGMERHCPQRTVLGILGADGAFAERVVVPVSNLHAVPETMPDRAAVFTEPLAAAFEIPEQVAIRPTDRCAVIGDGKLGLLIAAVLADRTGELIVLGHHPERQALLAALAPGALWRDAAEASRSDGGAPRFDIVIEASGNATGLELAFDLLRPRGILVLKSTYSGRPPINLAPLVIQELTLVGSRCGPFAPALRLLGAGFDPTPLIDSVYPLEKGVEALRHAASPGTLKVLLRP